MGIRRILIFLTFTLLCIPSLAQRRVSADVEERSVKDGKAVIVKKRVWCSSDGRMVSHFLSPQEFYSLANLVGEASVYNPSSNEVTTSLSEDRSSKGELLMIFLTGHIDDLSLSSYGYVFSSKRMDGKTLIKTFVSSSGKGAAKVDIAYENYLPIYVAYKDASGRVLSKKYLSHYSEDSGFLFPHRMVDILYSKKDSTIVRTLYSNIAVDSSDPMFSYEIPSDAVGVSLGERRKTPDVR